MEPDRYQQHHILYIVGLLCLVLGMGLLSFGAYLLPFIWLGWHYILPVFIFSWLSFATDNYNFSPNEANWLLWLLFVVPGSILILIADVLSNKIDGDIYGSTLSEKGSRSTIETSPSSAEKPARLVVRMILVVAAVFLVGQLFQWAIA